MSRKAILIVVLLATSAACGTAGQRLELLREVYAPAFGEAPPDEPVATSIAKLREELRSPAGHAFVSRLLPDQAGVLWLSLIVMMTVAFNFERLGSRRNVDLLLMFGLTAILFDVMRFFGVLGLPHYWALLDLVFTVVVLLNGTLAVRAVLRVRRPDIVPWAPGLRPRPLAALAIAMLTLNVLIGLIRDPDDAGYFVNLGAQRLRERGRMPYGDPLLTGTPGAAYGPVLYAVHVPFQFLLEPRSPNRTSPPRPVLGEHSTYYLPSALATKLCTIFLHLIGVGSLFVAGRRLAGDPSIGWALVALYCSSASVLGIGGSEVAIGGITFVSHIGPTALTLAAFAALSRPATSGALLAVAAGAGFYPAFFVPAWIGYFWRERAQVLRFAVGAAITAGVICSVTWAASQPANGRGRIGTILSDTLGHHTDPQGYGRSQFGFWGQREGWRAWFVRPLVGQSSLATPAYLLFFGFMGLTFFLARGASLSQLALLSAALAIGAHLLKVHSTGTYLAWAYPFLLLGFLATGTGSRGRDSTAAHAKPHNERVR